MRALIYILSNTRCRVDGLDDRTAKLLDDALSMEIPGAKFSPQLQNGMWDGRRHLFNVKAGTFPKGLLPKVRAFLKEAGVRRKTIDMRTLLPAPKMERLQPEMLKGITLREYQTEAVRNSLEQQCGILWLATNCMSGDTQVEVHRASKSFKLSLSELFTKHHDRGKRPRSWESDIETMIRMRDAQGSIVLAPVADVIRSGMKTTYTLRTVDGRSVRATQEHRFLTDRGWLRLKQLVVGDLVYMDGGRVPQKRQAGRYVAFGGMDHHPYRSKHNDKRPGRRTYYSVQAHRLVYEAYLSGLPFDEYLGRLRAGQVRGLRFIDPEVEHVHHVNGDVSDNALYNLELVNRVVHLHNHGTDHAWRNVTARTVLVAIESITLDGMEETYDVEVDHPEHNFLANGFVVHNSGKTECAAAMMKVLKERRCLFLVHKKALLSQTRERVAKRLGTIEEHIGIIGEGRFEPRHITIATIQSLTRKMPAAKAKIVKQYLSTIELLFIDEGHHAKAVTWYKLVQKIQAQYRYILSGTPFGSGNGLMVEATVGPVVARVSNEQLIKLGVSAVPTIEMVEVTEPEIESGRSWDEVYKEGIVANTMRNGLIAKRAVSFARKKLPTLILVRELWHGDMISTMLESAGIRHAFVHGKMPMSMVEKEKARFEMGKHQVLIASPIFDEGVDVPAIKALIVADGGKSPRSVLQKIGRGLRRKEDGNTLKVVDFADYTHKWLATHSQERLSIYSEEGFQIVT